jgi:hypothetical protein
VFAVAMPVVFLTAVPITVFRPNLFLFLIAVFSFYLVATGWLRARNRDGAATAGDWIAVTVMAATAIAMAATGRARLRGPESRPMARPGPGPVDAPRAPRATPRAMLDEEDVRKIVQAVRAVFHAEQSVTGEIADRWSGGQLVLKPGKPGTQEKTVPIESFFRKLTAVREKLRVLEQRINSHPKLTDEDRLQLQDYITRIYGSLTTFNVLFADPADRFVGTGGRDEG